MDTAYRSAGICLIQDTTQCNSQTISIFQESDSACFLFANQEELLLHRNQSGVILQLILILISMLEVKLIDVITSFVSL